MSSQVQGLNGNNAPDSSWRLETERALEDLDKARVAMLDAHQAAEFARADFERKREDYLKRIQSVPVPVPSAQAHAAVPERVAVKRGPRDGLRRVLLCLERNPSGRTLDQISVATGLGRAYLKTNLMPRLQREGKAVNYLGDWSLAKDL